MKRPVCNSCTVSRKWTQEAPSLVRQTEGPFSELDA